MCTGRGGSLVGATPGDAQILLRKSDWLGRPGKPSGRFKSCVELYTAFLMSST